MTEIEVHEVHASREGDVIVLALRGTANGADAHLILSLDERPDQQDVDLGMVGVHAEWNDQAHSGYGLIGSVRRTGTDLAIAITESGRALGMPDAIMLRDASRHLGEADRIIADRMMDRL